MRLPAFLRNTGGNVGVIVALGLVPLIGAAGVALDHSRATGRQVELQTYADGAALSAVRADPSMSDADREALAVRIFSGSVAAVAGLTITDVSAQYFRNEGRLVVRAVAGVSTTLSRVLGFETTSLSIVSEVTSKAPDLELALVLDVTGSMSEDMDALKRAATGLVDIVLPAGVTSRSKVAVVPFVASVNVGTSFPIAFLDTRGGSEHHARSLEYRTIARMTGCQTPPPPPSAGGGWGGGGGTPPPPDNGPGRGGGSDRRSSVDGTVEEFLHTLAAIGGEILGVSSARAEVTPNTRSPLSGAVIRVEPPETVAGVEAVLPEGFNHWRPCWLGNPGLISHWDLFARVPNVSWGGCVEARPEPFDVSDDAPDARDEDLLFVPYFWPDERDGDTVNRNDWLDDGALPVGWEFGGHWERRHSILKYDGIQSARIDMSGPRHLGPNAGCPEPMLPLTNQRRAILDKIAALQHIEHGGTITSEGIMWGLRALSPAEPFTQGAAFGAIDKFIVVMSDGMNSLIESGEGATKAEYGAYGFLREGRLPDERFDTARTYLDARMLAACDGAKAAGIRVFAVLYNEDDATARDMMRRCASGDGFYHEAASSTELAEAFRRIGVALGELRISR